MNRRALTLLLWFTPLVTAGGVIAFAYWEVPPTASTTALRQTLNDVTEVRVRLGALSPGNGHSHKTVITLRDAEAQHFAQSLRVKYENRFYLPSSYNPYTFEFYKGKKLMLALAYYPDELLRGDGKDWGDGQKGSGRTLTWGTRHYLGDLLAPYESLRKTVVWVPGD